MAYEIPVTQARADLAELVNRVAYSGERVVLTRHGKPVAALVSALDLELLEELRSERVDLRSIGQVAEQQQTSAQSAPLPIAAQYRPGGPSGTSRPGLGY